MKPLDIHKTLNQLGTYLQTRSPIYSEIVLGRLDQTMPVVRTLVNRNTVKLYDFLKCRLAFGSGSISNFGVARTVKDGLSDDRRSLLVTTLQQSMYAVMALNMSYKIEKILTSEGWI